jgi:hypothetical protein
VFGDDGNALVYGHLGGDSCNCDNRNDTVRGGQGNDTLIGEQVQIASPGTVGTTP